ncbi:MAG TPA: DUF6448 family protein [Clostridiaceae bacterium]|nr:DUF6448 family protein [Clostridiaceae bacterium]
MMLMIQMLTGILLVGAWLWLFPKKAAAHCDTIDGPTAKDGMKALETGNIHHAYKWIMPEYEEELKSIFELSMKVRNLSADAKEVADRFFLENLVRIHRAGEGAPFIGLKPHGVPIEPAVAAADRSLETGNIEPLRGLVEEARFPELEKRFQKALSLREFDADDVERGRAYIEAYVSFFKFAEGEEHEHDHGHHDAEGHSPHGSEDPPGQHDAHGHMGHDHH